MTAELGVQNSRSQFDPPNDHCDHHPNYGCVWILPTQ